MVSGGCRGKGRGPVKGTLEIAHTGEMNLELLGTITGEDGGWLSKEKLDLERSRVRPLVHGVGRGSTFTLLDCFQTKSSLHTVSRDLDRGAPRR